MTKMKARYLGNLQVECEHAGNGAKIVTDAPLDNYGQGRSFSPTDLFASSLAACMLTIMGIFAERAGVDITGATAEIEKQMSDSPRKVAVIDVCVHMPGKAYSPAEKVKLERAALSCPVHATLKGQVEMRIRFDWPE